MSLHDKVHELTIKIDERIRGMLRSAPATEDDARSTKRDKVQMGSRKCELLEVTTKIGWKHDPVRTVTVKKGCDTAVLTLDEGLITLVVNGKTLCEDRRITEVNPVVLDRALPLLDRLANESCCGWKEEPPSGEKPTDDPLEALDKLAA
jgi:hypothetical protein